jgi:hypothetical protein
VTDRFDCQVMMGIFSYVYYWAYVSRPEVTVPDVLQSALKLGDPQQVELFMKLGNLLVGEGILPGGWRSARRAVHRAGQRSRAPLASASCASLESMRAAVAASWAELPSAHKGSSGTAAARQRSGCDMPAAGARCSHAARVCSTSCHAATPLLTSSAPACAESVADRLSELLGTLQRAQ